MNFSSTYSLQSNEVILTTDDAKPVHALGCIQSLGVLLAIHPHTYKILQVSNNSQEWLEEAPHALQGRHLKTVIGSNNFDSLYNFISNKKIEFFPRYVFTMVIAGRSLDFLVHCHDNLIILEAEEASEPDTKTIVNTINSIFTRILKETQLKPFCQTLVNEVRTLIGVDRVMIYKFHKDDTGEIFAEAKRDDLPSYLHLRYPAEDLPHAVREAFRKIWVRYVPDVFSQQSEIVPTINPYTQKPLDQTYAFLRGVSIMHTDYLKNMSVGMILILSIIVDGKLWGLISCHHTTSKIIPWPLRARCEVLAQITSLQLKEVQKIESDLYIHQSEKKISNLVEKLLESNKLISEVVNEKDLYHFVNSSGIAILEEGQWFTHGIVPTSDQLDEVADFIKEEISHHDSQHHIWHTRFLSKIFEAANEYSSIASGVLAMSLSPTHDHMILWFRPELVHVVNWAGNPQKPMENSPQGPRLLPRTSSSLWQESVKKHSEEWEKIEIKSVEELRHSLIEVLVARTQAIKELNASLSISNQELESFAYVASHDLQEPLRGINFYAHMIKDEIENNKANNILQQTNNIIRLSERMKNLIESLLNFSRLEHTTQNFTNLDMKILLQEALDTLRRRIEEKKPLILIQEEFPPVYGDATRLRELWTNLISNALKYTNVDKIQIEIGTTLTEKGETYFIRDNGIGIQPQYHTFVFQIFKRLNSEQKYQRGSGVGLSIVKRVVEKHEGEIWIKNNPDTGITIFFTLNKEPSPAEEEV
jgi:light-regulated signal transduction histidine kinase (bacteriophytochrome)